MDGLTDRVFVCYVFFVGFQNISLGITVDWFSPNVEIHLPFCFIKIGWEGIWYNTKIRIWGKWKRP